jgi:hypothetical protein
MPSNANAVIASAELLTVRRQAAIATAFCNTKYEGAIRRKGDRVKILTPGEVELFDYTKNTDMPDPQVLDDAEQFLEITESKAFQYYEDDVDKAQNELDEEYEEETAANAAYKIADYNDRLVYSKYTEAGRVIIQAALTSENFLSVLADVAAFFTIANVPQSTPKRFEISPEVFAKGVMAKVFADTDNSKTLRTGFIRTMFGLDIFQSNNIVKEGEGTGAVCHCIARTKRAIAFAEQINETEVIRHHKRFGDVHRGLMLSGCKVVVPSELFEVRLTIAAES